MLPPEVLGIIFTRTTSPILASSGCRVEIILSQVSRYWREVAISTPHIWQNAVVSPQHPSHHKMLEIYLERSGTLPLNLRVTEAGAILDKVLAVVLSAFCRCQTLAFCARLLQDVADIPGYANHLVFPHLTELEFMDDRSSLAGDYVSLSFPHLQSLMLTEINEHDPTLALNIPFHNLTHLSVSLCENLWHVTQLLRLTPNLHSLHLLGLSFNDSSNLGLGDITLHYLIQFEVALQFGIAPALALLQFPHLKQLTLIFPFIYTGEEYRELVALFRRSLASVEIICIRFTADDSDSVISSDCLPALIPVLAAASKVRRLVLIAETALSSQSAIIVHFALAVIQALECSNGLDFMPSLKVLKIINLLDNETFDLASVVHCDVQVIKMDFTAGDLLSDLLRKVKKLNYDPHCIPEAN